MPAPPPIQLNGQPVDEFPQTVRVFFDDMTRRLGALRDSGKQLLLEADDPFLLIGLANHPALRTLVRLATVGERPALLVPDKDEAAAVRRLLKKLGYLPKKA